ncbi:hypothetical protein L9F63_007941, partial [Diploptera punctata]
MSGNRQDNKSPGPIPARWLHCPRKSAGLVVNKFLAFKTPLSSQYDDQVPEECRFEPGMVFASMKSYRIKLGLWIDLTNTSRFYNKKDIEAQGCKYVKLKCRGHGETPSADMTKAFTEICDRFISQHPLEIIAVHCTHGFNRTGFLIVSYLVTKMDWSVDAAVRHFASVRPPGIYKEDYLEELFRRYCKDDVIDPPEPPMLPEWCTDSNDDEEEDSNDRGSSGDTGESHSGRRRRREIVNKNPVFMEGVPGVTPVTEQPKLNHIQRKVQNFCGWK